MAGNLPVPQGVEVKIVWNLAGVPAALNILHFKHAVGALMDQAKATLIDQQVKASLTASGLLPGLHPTVQLHHVESRHMDASSDPWWVGVGAGLSGTGTGKPLPAATSYVISLKTGLRGRSFNGRFYQWGYVESANDTTGGITQAMSTATVSFVDIARQNLASGGVGTMSILSRFTTPPGSNAPTERPIPELTAVASVIARDLRWDVQRRRAIPGI